MHVPLHHQRHSVLLEHGLERGARVVRLAGVATGEQGSVHGDDAGPVSGLLGRVGQLGLEPRKLRRAGGEVALGVQEEEPDAAGLGAKVGVLAVETGLVPEALVVQVVLFGPFVFVIAGRR